MKRILTFFLTLVLILSLVGCRNGNPPAAGNGQGGVPTKSTANTDPSVLNFSDQGIQIKLKGSWMDLKDNILTQPVYGGEADPVSGVMVDFGNDEAKAKAQTLIDKKEQNGQKIDQALWDNSKRLYAIAYVKTGKVSMDTISELVGGPDRIANIKKLTVQGDTTFYFCTYPEDTSGLSNTSKEKYERLFKDLNTAKSNIVTSVPKERPKINSGTSVSFTTTDLNGKTVSSDIFKDHKLTMVNIWGSFCAPCIEELPMLQKLSDEMKDKNVAVVGILGDAIGSDGKPDKDNIDLGKSIMQKKKVSYLNLAMNKELEKALPTDAYPTTVFVDSKGNVIGKPIYGAQKEAEYKQAIQDALGSLSK